jgi:arginase
MVLRTAIDGGDVTSDRVVLAGTRVWDDPEAEYIAEAGIRSLTVDELADPASLVEAVAATGADAVYVHVDLDVLDPSALAGLLDPAPFGLTASALVAAIKALRSRFPLAGATLASYAPNALGTEEAVDDGATILRIIAALD